MTQNQVLSSLHADPTVAIIGASGGIGKALAEILGQSISSSKLIEFSRNGGPGIEHEDTVADYAMRAAKLGPIDAVIVATGVLHDENGLFPEKRLADLDADNLLRAFKVNAIGPALVAKHFLPLLRRDQKTVFAALSARVGSISDNRLGGWASYRSSKAALNMLLRTAAIEHQRSHPHSVVAAIHPGTVATRLSAPFRGNLQPGQLTAPDVAARNILQVMEQLTPTDSGALFAWDGTRIPF